MTPTHDDWDDDPWPEEAAAYWTSLTTQDTPVTQPRILHTHTWNGTRNLPDWLRPDHHHWDGSQLVIHHPDGTTPIQPGWWLIHWTDHTTTASPTAGTRVYGPDGIHQQLTRAEDAIARVRAYLDGCGRDFAVTPGSILALLDQPDSA